ncbi:MAG: T9SS type A sorting domain-containing protein, partial [Candidatus Firestonebacteria bacterium]|nr:T9SS type A sorting domain-containing protein [Candidatus Firestonebacteria bacterium]
NANAFCDGYGGLFPGDVIRVGTQVPVTVLKVDYANRQLTLSQPLTWNAQDGVSYFYMGAKPDIGAYEFGVTTTAGTIAGVVTDHETGSGLAGVSLSAGGSGTSSDSAGGYRLTLPPGNYTLTCSRSGYVSQDKPIGIISGETVWLNWRMESTAGTTHNSLNFTVSPSIYVRGKSPSESIRFGNLPQEATIRIFTLAGRMVTTLHHAASSAGLSEDWDIRDMASGIYIYLISSAQKQQKGKLAIVK